MARYVVRCRDVDGGSSRSYKSLIAADRRFKEMSGLSIVDAVSFNRDVPADKVDVASLKYASHVSDYGCVVSFSKVEEES
jgi:hypothetical protein